MSNRYDRDHSSSRFDEERHGRRPEGGQGFGSGDEYEEGRGRYGQGRQHESGRAGYGDEDYGPRGYGEYGAGRERDRSQDVRRGYGSDLGSVDAREQGGQSSPFASRRDYGSSGGWQASQYGGPNREQGGYGPQGSARQGPYAGRGPKGYQRSDERIREDIGERLEQHGDIDASEIEVKVESGVVTLTGTVDSRHAKRLAEDVCEGVSGVKDVQNQIRVQSGQQAQQGSPGGTQSQPTGAKRS